MKFALTALLTVSFLGIAVFGVFAMDHGSGNGHEGCIASAARGMECPSERGVLASAVFHLDAFRSFSTAVVGHKSVAALLILVVVMFAIAAHIRAGTRFLAPVRAMHGRRQFPESHASSFQHELTSWLALHENSPSVA